jgi:hypothetical protein
MGARASNVALRKWDARGRHTFNISIMLATALRPSTRKTCAEVEPKTTVASSVRASIAASIAAY